MESIQLTDLQRELIERLGVHNEQMGMPPTEARILSLLIVCDVPELTFDQIRNILSISKSATSNGLNLLLLSQQITYKTRFGDRKRYFTSNISNLEDVMTTEIQKMVKIAQVMKEVLVQRPPDTEKFNEQLGNFIAFMEYMHEELPQLLSRWNEKKESKKTKTR